MNLKTPSVKILKKLNLETLPGVTNKYYGKSIFGFSTFQKVKQYRLKPYKISIINLNKKRKIKFIFGLKEYQLKNVFKKFSTKTFSNLYDIMIYLNTKLDIFLVKLGFFKTIKESRQYIKHGNVFINGYKITVYNFLIKPLDIIFVRKNLNLVFFILNFKNFSKNTNTFLNTIVNINKQTCYILRNYITREYLNLTDFNIW